MCWTPHHKAIFQNTWNHLLRSPPLDDGKINTIGIYIIKEAELFAGSKYIHCIEFIMRQE